MKQCCILRKWQLGRVPAIWCIGRTVIHYTTDILSLFRLAEQKLPRSRLEYVQSSLGYDAFYPEGSKKKGA